MRHLPAERRLLIPRIGLLKGCVGFLLLALAVPFDIAIAAPAVKKKTTKVKVAPPKKVAAPKRKAAPRAPRVSVRNTVPIRRVAVAAPAPVAAEIPVVAQPAVVWRGCLESNDVFHLAARLQMEESHLRTALNAREMLAATCVPYVAAVGGEGGAATALFHGSPSMLVVSRTAAALEVVEREFRCPETAGRLVSFSGREFVERRAELLTGLPDSVQWQLDVLIPRMMPPGDGYQARVAVSQDAAHVQSVEIVDARSGKLVDGAWWVERRDGPGTIVGLNGAAYERSLWLSPVAFTVKSRGAGPTAQVVRRSFAAPKGSPKGGKQTRIVTVRGFHLGADLIAPTGTPIHTVGDGRVAFVGRLGGYGNLVIVDHGRGYETYYAHLSAFQPGVKVGTTVTRGDVLGKVGSTGRSTAPHLHFETRKDKQYIDPYDENRQLEFWMLTAEEHERLAMRVLAGTGAVSTGVATAGGGLE